MKDEIKLRAWWFNNHGEIFMVYLRRAPNLRRLIESPIFCFN